MRTIRSLERQEREKQGAGQDARPRQPRTQHVDQQRERCEEEREVDEVEDERPITRERREDREVHLARKRPVIVAERPELDECPIERHRPGLLEEQVVVVQEPGGQRSPVQQGEPDRPQNGAQPRGEGSKARHGANVATPPRARESR
jgi:hypothetical protein